MTGQATIASSPSEKPRASGNAPYRLAAISLGIVAIVVAIGVFGYGFSDYYVDSTCLPTGGSLGSQRLPVHCNLPVNSILLAGVILFGGISYAARVWSRR